MPLKLGIVRRDAILTLSRLSSGVKQRPMTKLLLLLALVSCANLGHADWDNLPSTDFEIEPFPTKGSSAQKRDFEILFEYQKTNRGPACELADKQPHPSFSVFFEKSGLLSKSEARLVKNLMSKVIDRMERITSYHKDHFKRPRPYQMNGKIKPCVSFKPSGHRSYPSSHASTAQAGACVLAEIFPDRKEQFYSLGKYLGDLRVIVGVHHPSDVEAGQKLGQEFCVRILEDYRFRRALKELGLP